MTRESNVKAVVGAGLMGNGIAHVLARLTGTVYIYDISPVAIDSALCRIRKALSMLVANGLTTSEHQKNMLDRIHPTTDLQKAVSSASFIVEAVPENLELKRQLLYEIDRLSPTEAIIATNTSSLPISQISDRVSGQDRVVGSHFFLPAYIIPLVEVSRGKSTSEQTMVRTMDMWRACGKVPIRVEADIPGYVANRIQAAIVREAVNLWSQKIASASDIDTAVQLGFGLRYLHTGPLKQRDIGGLDLHVTIADTMWKDLDNRADANPKVRSKVSNGETGLKSGRGFYDWTEKDPEEVHRSLDESLASAMSILGIWPTGSANNQE